MSLRNIFYKLAHDVSRYPNIVQLTNTLDHGFKEVAEHIQDGGSEVEVTPVYTSGEKLATITVDGDDNDIYMPNGEVKTMEGSSFKTVNGSLVDEMKIGFAPIQDLHGYSKPWAGGAGKNLFDKDTMVINAYFVNNGNIMSLNEGRVIYAPCQPNTPYTISKLAGARFRVGTTRTLPALGVTTYQGTTNETASSITITTDNDAQYIVAFVYHSSYDTVTADEMLASCQIEKGSSATSYEPYANICPITGHTQVQSKINNTTNTTSLGDTYYGGEVEQVGGTGTVVKVCKTADGTEAGWNYNGNIGGYFDNPTFFGGNKRYGVVTTNQLYTAPNYEYFESNRNCIFSATNLNFKFTSDIDNVTKLQTYLASHPLQVCYELDTPTALTLTGQNIVADVGVNEVSAPLTGQSIEEVKYHQMMTIQDVEKLTE